VGASVANALPWALGHLGVVGYAANGVPLSVQYAFKLGAAVFLLAVLWTIVTTDEYPPEDLAEFERQRAQSRSFHVRPGFLLAGALIGAALGASRGALVDRHLTGSHVLAGALIGAAIGLALSAPDVSAALREMPRTMRQLAVVQFFTWFGLFCMWMFFGLATAQQVFGTRDPRSPSFDQGIAFGGTTFMVYSLVCFLVAFALPALARRVGRKAVHATALAAGAAGLLATGAIHGWLPWMLTMVGVGVAWASILSIPYAILSSALPPARVGVYMGIFNFFIVLPEILISVALAPVIRDLFGNDPVKVVMLGGGSLLLAALATLFVDDEAR
jgi:maltose/moltooligosaccharide transporter